MADAATAVLPPTGGKKRAKRAAGRQPGLGNSGITLPRQSTPVTQQTLQLPSGLNRQAVRALHRAHRQRPDTYKPLTKEERKERGRRSRLERWQRRHELRTFTTLRSVKRCGVAPIVVKDSNGEKHSAKRTLRVSQTPDGKRAGYGGLQHCGSVWACPVCSATVATRRAQDIAKVLKWALDQGYSASFMTLTMRHFKRHRLRDVWNAVSKGWGAATGGKRWVAEQEQNGIVGWVKAVEATHGQHGWHVHLHVLLIWDRGTAADQMRRELVDDGDDQEVTLDDCRDALTLADARDQAGAMHRRWTAALQRLGFDSIADKGGLDVRLASLKPSDNGLHQYFTKMAFEVSGGYAKQANGKGRAPFQILGDALTTGLVDDFDLWAEWEHGSRGRRQIGWSQDIRERAGLGAELTDEEAANEELPADECITLNEKTGAWLDRHVFEAVRLLEVVEDGGIDAACTWLDERKLMWHSRRLLPRPGE